MLLIVHAFLYQEIKFNISSDALELTVYEKLLISEGYYYIGKRKRSLDKVGDEFMVITINGFLPK